MYLVATPGRSGLYILKEGTTYYIHVYSTMTKTDLANVRDGINAFIEEIHQNIADGKENPTKSCIITFSVNPPKFSNSSLFFYNIILHFYRPSHEIPFHEF